MELPRRRLLAVGSLVLAGAGTVGPTYLVFFDWEQTELTTRGLQMIKEAAIGISRFAGRVSTIQVVGRAEASEDVDLQEDLAQTRAKVVVAALVASGLPRQIIAYTSLGARSPLVPARPGERRQENRSVEIWAQTA